MVAGSGRRIAIPGVVWRAGDRLGIGHCLLPRQTRYLCNARAVPDRFAWPVVLRCSTCADRLVEMEREAARERQTA